MVGEGLLGCLARVWRLERVLEFRVQFMALCLGLLVSLVFRV